MKAEKRTLLIMSLIAAWVLLPIAAYGQEETSGPPATPLPDSMSVRNPPVEQPLVPEGVLAVQLVEALKMGQTQDEAQAENLLSAVGIEPKNGWIAGYPVTPAVIGEIEKGVATAAAAGRLGMGKEPALKAVGNLKAQLGLSVTPGATLPSASQTAPSGGTPSTIIYKYIDKNGVVHFTDRYETIPQEYRDRIEMIRETVQPQPSVGPAQEEAGEQANNYPATPSPEVINNYYYNEGPPVVTYYAPPEPYYYLYSWVPYPFWCSGFFFPGFFMLHDFHRHVFFHNHPFVVTNHVANAVGNRVFVVDPVGRGLRGSGVANRLASQQVFRSPAVQSNARTIVGVSQNRMTSAGGSTAPRVSNVAPSTSRSRPQGQIRPNQGPTNGQRVSQPRSTFEPPRVSEGRVFSRPGVTGRSFSPAPSRVFSAHATGGRGSFGGFRGGGGFSGHGGSFGGGARGHR
jgi:uncharacterized membrane protein YgcG